MDGRTQWYGPVPWQIMEKGLLSLGRFRREATWRPWIKGLSGKIDAILGRQELKRTDRAVSIMAAASQGSREGRAREERGENKAEAGVTASRKQEEKGGRKREGRAGRGRPTEGRIFLENRTRKATRCVCRGLMGEHSSTMQ